MPDKFIIPKGKPVDLALLHVYKAQELAFALSQERIEFASFVECRTDENGDTIVFDVDVEVSQLRKYDIRNRERIATVFYEKDNRYPEVLALRSNFPKVPHLNLRDEEIPRSLCLYEEKYRDLKSRWTAPRFVERIREWLKLTAKGKLHQDDQPLEPLISGFVGNIVLPQDILNINKDLPEMLYLTGKGDRKDMIFLVAEREKPSSGQSLQSVASIHRCLPQEHGIINRRLRTLAEVAIFVKKSGLNILTELRNRLKDWLEENSKENNFLDNPLIFVVICPKIRHKGKKPESRDVWVFITGDTCRDVGKKIGVFEQQGDCIALLIPFEETKNGDDINVDLLNPSYHLTKELAANLNGINNVIDSKITAVGVGALGSQVVMNLARCGIGTWNLIDNDHLMPHNVTRHALVAECIGFKKSETLAFIANNFIHNAKCFKGISADVIEPQENVEEVKDALKNADVILDMSASVTVARHLALNIDSSAKRISLFLNPSGEELVLLAESNKRSIKLDELEMQLYRAIIQDKHLGEHFKPSEGRLRYGQSCRDITVTLPQDVVALHAAIGGRALREVLQSEESQITVWKSDTVGNVKRIDVSVASSIRYQVGEWTVVTDKDVLQKLYWLRNDKLPNETGGILIGSFDFERKTVYIVDTIPSPPDSKEWPTLYIRGSKGLKEKATELVQKTAGMLEYIGEWHSHPNGISTAPGKDDIKVFAWLTELMDRDGLPAMMIIAGENNHVSCFIGKINSAESLIPCIK